MKKKIWIPITLVCLLFFGGCTFVVTSLVGTVLDGGFSGSSYSSAISRLDGFTSEIIEEGNGSKQILRIFLEGVIASGEVSFTDVIAQLDHALEQSDIQAIVLYVNSPGGTVIASEELYQKILEVKETGKKVVVSMGNVAASGGYYIAMAADDVFSHEATITGSIGVIYSLGNYRKAAEKIGYEETAITSGRYKNMGSPMVPLQDDVKALFQTLVDESYARFVDVVAQGRKMSAEQVRTLADGRIYSGKQAVKNGLVDQLGTLEDATAHAAKLIGVETPEVIQFEREPSVLDLFSGVLSQKTVADAWMKELLPQTMQLKGLLYLYAL